MTLSEKLRAAGVNPVLVNETERLERELAEERVTSEYWHAEAGRLREESIYGNY